MDDPLTLILAEARAHRDAAVRHFEGLDTKTGIIMGFSGALTAFPASGVTVLLHASRAASVAATLLALAALLPRRFPVLYGQVLRDRHADSSPEVVTAALVEYLVRHERPAERVLRAKAGLLIGAAVSLGLGVLLLGVGSMAG